MKRWLHAGPVVTGWLIVLAVGLMFLGAGAGYILISTARKTFSSHTLKIITLYSLTKPVQLLIVFGIGFILVLIALRQLQKSSLGLTFSVMEQNSPGQVFVTRQADRGLPSSVLFSGHMGMLVVLNALQDSVGSVTAVTPPGSDYRSIARLLRPSHGQAHVISATAENAELCATLINGRTVTGYAQLEQALEAPVEQLFLSSQGASLAPPEAGLVTPTAASWPVSPGIEDAIAGADLIVFGPGSFYTSVLPALLVPGILRALSNTQAATVYICNIMTEPGRTDGWSVSDYIEHFKAQAGFAPRYTIVNRSYPGSNILNRYEVTGSFPVMVTPEEHIDASKVVLGSRLPGSTTLDIGGSTVIEADIIEVINESRLTFDQTRGTASEQTVTVIRHDSEKLARALRNIIALTRVPAPVA